MLGLERLVRREKLLNRNIRSANQTSQGAFGDFLVRRYGEGGDVTVLGHYDVAALLPGNAPAQWFEYGNSFTDSLRG